MLSVTAVVGGVIPAGVEVDEVTERYPWWWTRAEVELAGVKARGAWLARLAEWRRAVEGWRVA